MTQSHPMRVAVVGAASQIGQALILRLENAGMQVCRIGRQLQDRETTTHVFDPECGSFAPPLASADAVICLAPLATISQVLKMTKALGAGRIIAFGSTGRFTKVDSSSELEQDFVRQQVQAEQLLASECAGASIHWTLFRPTMIYGANADLTVAFIDAIIRKFHFFPIPAGAKGRRQPVHVDDLAVACVAALECPRTFNKAYNLGGGEILTFPDLVRRIFRAEGKRPLLLPIPMWLYRLMIHAASKLKKYQFIRVEMLERMRQDLTADIQPAVEDFGYAPRPFAPIRSLADGG